MAGATTASDSSLVGRVATEREENEAGEITSWIRRTVLCASLYLFLTYMAFSMMATPFPEVALEWACKDQGLSWKLCNKVDGGDRYDDAQKAMSNWLSEWSLMTGVLQVAMCGFYGVLGDSVGRRYALLIPLLGMTCQGLCLALVPGSRKDDLLLVLGFFTSIGGGCYATNHAACATVADVTQKLSPKQRSAIFGIVEAASAAGVMVGPLVGSTMAKLLGNQQAFFPAVAVMMLNLVIALCFYRETLEWSRLKPFSLARANPVAAFSMFFHGKFVLVMGGMLFFFMLCANGASSVLPSYMNYAIVDLDPRALGMAQALGAGSGFVGLLLIFPLLVKRLSLHAILRVAISNCCISFLLLSAANQIWQFELFLASQILVVMVYPIMRTGMVSYFGKTRYGEALAAMGTLEQTMGMIAPVIMQQVYGATIKTSIQLGDITIGCMALVACAASALVGFAVTFCLGNFPTNTDNATRANDCQP